MRIHSDHLTQADIVKATMTDDMAGVYVTATPHGSRARARAFEVRLTGTSPYWTMDGQDHAATWDEWGVFFARLFEIDPNMLAGTPKNPTYRDADHFHLFTRYRFDELTIPADTHPRHNWAWGLGVTQCTKCSAEMERGV